MIDRYNEIWYLSRNQCLLLNNLIWGKICILAEQRQIVETEAHREVGGVAAVGLVGFWLREGVMARNVDGLLISALDQFLNLQDIRKYQVSLFVWWYVIIAQ